MNPEFKKYLLKITHSSSCEEVEVIQSLWSGYGKISRYNLAGSEGKTVVVKEIVPEQSSDHPRGWNTDKSHTRKLKSYQVETVWYQKWNQLCSKESRVPSFIGSFTEGSKQWIILEDLNVEFPLRKDQITIDEVKVCLNWMANFHGRFLNKEPNGLWKIGTYWHLETRPDEYEKIDLPELKAKAHKIDEVLNNAEYQTIVHGDAKLANFCFSEDGKSVAAVDFQYVGGGCGMKDVAYFLGSCLSSSACESKEDELLNFYFSKLEKSILNYDVQVQFKVLEQEWRTLYPFAIADFTRFLFGWMPSHQKVNRYHLNYLNFVLSKV